MPTRVQARRERFNRWLWALVDSGVWVVAIFLGAWLRYDLNAIRSLSTPLVVLALAAIAAQLGAGAAIGPYAVGHERGSFEETYDVAKTVGFVAVVLAGLVYVVQLGPIPRSVPFTAPAFAMLGMFAARFIIRTARTNRAAAAQTERHAIVFGAGDAGRQLTRSLIRDPSSGYHPVALLDDDPTKARLRVEGIKVRGTRADMARVAAAHDADTLIIALPQAEAATLRALVELAEEAGLTALTLPPVREIFGGRPTAGDLRDVDVADLLGRRPVMLDMAAIAEQIAGKRVLVTGAGGSIGSELCRQIMRFRPDRLFLLDRDESGLQATELSLDGTGLLDSDDLILANIREMDATRVAFERARPDIVFHAAALKHLPLLESHPLEAWKTNVMGTLNVLQAAAETGVGTFVNISTDKAANPTCALGYSKRIAERLTADFADRYPGRYVSVRFGNVLGSRGSVVHAFTAQIERGGPITVTHPDVQRYFMLIPEACQLVLQAASIGSDGEVMVLEMGEQVKIVEVARTLLRMAGRPDIDIVYTGLRPGEKLAEELFSPDEDRMQTEHPLLSSVTVPALDVSYVTDPPLGAPSRVVERMRHAGIGADLFAPALRPAYREG
jgi:FlaA1/EpsC-like NDP-sugar epimerase